MGSSTADPEGHVERHLPALEEHGEGISLLHVTREPLEVRHRANRLAVQLLDHVATLHAGLGRRAAVLDSNHHHAVSRAKVQLSRDVWRDRPDLEPEHRPRLPAWALLLGL